MKSSKTLLIMLFLLPCVAASAKSESHIVISKQRACLYVIEQGDTVFAAPVSVGKNKGDKQHSGDCRTPEGTFPIVHILNSSTWTHDFKDGFGRRRGAYGPYFIRLKTPRFSGIGIHGTCFPEKVGTRCSEGCIRLQNDSLLQLMEHIHVGMNCIIEPD